MESEIKWNINESDRIYLRFYFPHYVKDHQEGEKGESNSKIYSSISFSQI
jgi:hypothetical protein